MAEQNKLIDADIVRLKLMYLEEKVNLNENYVFLENGIWRLTPRSFLNGRFCMSCPENFEEIVHSGAPPFSVLRAPHKSIVLTLYEVQEQVEEKETIYDSFTRLFTKELVDESGVLDIDSYEIKWLDYRRTMSGVPFFHQIFSAKGEGTKVIGHVHAKMNEYDRSKKLMRRLLRTIKFHKKEED